jgi:hypothetical protein
MMTQKRALTAALLCGTLFVLGACQNFPARGGDVQDFDVTILTGARAMRSRQGERLTGYLAEYESDVQKHVIFLSLEIVKYEKGERLSVKGILVDDSVRMPYGDQVNADIPYVRVLEARPLGVKAELEKLASDPDKKR